MCTSCARQRSGAAHVQLRRRCRNPNSFHGGTTMTNVRSLTIRTLLYAPLLAAQTAANWTQQFPQTSPPARIEQAMAYDAAQGQVVLFGGEVSSFNSSGSITTTSLGDTWLWDGANWTQTALQTGPPARENHAMAYDSTHGQVVLFGGGHTYGDLTNENILNDTWVWDGTNWTQKFPQTSPPARELFAMAYDSAHGQVVLFGGTEETDDFTGLNDTWVWD